jgi:glycosyltransferase involved in cell wall biosynthesis
MSGLTVAVCTHDRPQQLARALASVMDQSPQPAEVLVVDNAPSDETTRRLVEDQFPQARYLREPVPGLDFARNRALTSATQDVVAFLDDDAVAAPGWGGAMSHAFVSDERVGLCTGRVEALKLETPGERLFEANGGFSRGTEPIELPADAGRLLHGRRAPLIAWAISVGSGCNYGVRRSAALALGGFDEALDLGAALPGGGDHDLLWRMLQAGHTVVYQPAALAWHEHRDRVEAVHAQIVGHQRAVIAFLGKQLIQASNGTRASLATYLAWRLVKPGVRLARRAVGRDPLPAPVLLRMWWNCWAGLVAYPRAKRLARSRRQEHET